MTVPYVPLSPLLYLCLSVAAGCRGWPVPCAALAVAAYGLATARVGRASAGPGAPRWLLRLERWRRYLACEPRTGKE